MLQNPCSYCEVEFNVPNVGESHGICNRHFLKWREEFGLPPGKPNPNNKTMDLKELSPEELHLAVNLHALAIGKRA